MKLKKKELEFPKEIKEKCDRYLNRKNLEITYLNGYIMQFTGTNISTISPYKILLKSSDTEVVILYYREHLYDEELFFINDTKNGRSFQKLRELVVNYFFKGEDHRTQEETVSFEKGDFILIDKEEVYYWNGNCKRIMVCTPAWYKEQCKLLDL